MPTRWYLTKSAHTTINPGTKGVWDSESSKQILNFNTLQNTDASFTTYTVTGMSTTTSRLMRQYISPGMAAGVIFDTSTTFKLVMRCKESTSLGNLFMRMVVAIVSEDGVTERGYKFASTDGSEFSTSLEAAEISTSGHGPSYTTVAGDRLVVEIGWNKTSTNSVDGSIQIGNVGTADLTGVGDTGVKNGWFEVSVTAGTGTGGGTPPSTVEDFNLEGYITGVLDEWA